MSEMIERGALAIKAIADLHNSIDHTFRFSTPEEIMEGYRDMIRAAIEAMREPPVEIAMDYFADSYGADLWRMFIKTILSDKPEDVA